MNKTKYTFGKNLRYSEYSSKDAGYNVYSVFGEDSNCDMGGSHINPFLGNVEGTFSEVLEYAANEMPNFYQWGGGGYIVPKDSLKNDKEPKVVNKAKKVKIERKKKLHSIESGNFNKLIEKVDSMSKDEIKQAIKELRDKYIKI